MGEDRDGAYTVGVAATSGDDDDEFNVVEGSAATAEDGGDAVEAGEDVFDL